MKSNFILAISTISILMFCSCKNDNEPSDTNALPVYMPLAIGNYWIYQNYSIDSLGNERLLNQIDSVAITKDTLINNKKYFVMYENKNSPNLFPHLLRDSLGYIVSNNGAVMLSSINTTDTISKRYYWSLDSENPVLIAVLKFKMELTPKTITVAAGKFDIITCHGYLTAFYKDANSKFFSVSIDENDLYALNIGQIINTYHYYTTTKDKIRYEKRLLRYNVNLSK